MSPDLLFTAIGESNRGLPSPEQLSQLIARAELGLLVNQPSDSEELLATAWYLHGIGSASEAINLYGIERQRAAFQVSARIFDLWLRRGDLEEIQQLKLCFACQVAYVQSEFSPNSMAVYRREMPSAFARPNSDQWIDWLSNSPISGLRLGVSALAMDIDYIYDVTRGFNVAKSAIAESWGMDDLKNTPFAALVWLAEGCYNLATFLRYGNTDNLQRGREAFVASAQTEPFFGEFLDRWVAAHLARICDGLQRTSIWTALPPAVPKAVRDVFARLNPKVFTLWPPQMELFSGQTQPLDPESKRVFLSMPTSSGKTLTAQLMIAAHLATQTTSVCVVAPSRSLCREIRVALDQRLRSLNVSVREETPLHALLNLIRQDQSVEVMTPEQLGTLMRANPDALLSRFGLFIFDEVHHVADQQRGFTLEAILSFLHNETLDRGHKIVAISAVVGNQHHFLQWLTSGVDTPIQHDNPWRGPRQLHAVWQTIVKPNSYAPRKTKGKTNKLEAPLYGLLTVRAADGRFQRLESNEAVGVNVIDAQKGTKISGDSTPFYHTLVPLIEHLMGLGSVLVVSAQRPETVRLALRLAEQAPNTSSSETLNQVIELATSHLSSAHPLVQVLRKGVAFHHGALPLEVRSALEQGVLDGSIHCLVATTTLSEGVNLPVRSVVIASQGIHREGGFLKHITGAKLINAIGRAGRATKETEGLVVLAWNQSDVNKAFAELSPDSEELHAASVLATEEALSSLAEYETSKAQTIDAVFVAASKTHLGNFISHVWFLLSRLEQAQRALTKESLQVLLEKTLFWLQLNDSDRERWLSLGTDVLGKYLETSERSRIRWAKTGSFIPTARAVEEIAGELAQHIQSSGLPDTVSEQLRLLLQPKWLERIQSFSEAPRNLTRQANRGQKANLIDVLLDWIDGQEVSTIADRHFTHEKTTEGRLEQAIQYIYENFEVFLPWILGSICTEAQSILEAQGSDQIIAPNLPRFVRWGVDNSDALTMLLEGITSRRLALAISRAFELEGGASSVKAWLRARSIEDWARRFDLSASRLRQMIDFARSDGQGIAARILKREQVILEFSLQTSDLPEIEAYLRIWKNEANYEEVSLQTLGGTRIRLPLEFQSDLFALLKSNVDLACRLAITHQQAILKMHEVILFE